jgi:hypothetical protein
MNHRNPDQPPSGEPDVLRILALSGCALALTACATSSAAKPKSCNGHDRRPVNVHGSVLPGSPVPAVTAPVPTPPTPGPDGRPAKTAKSPAAAPPAVPAIELKTPASAVTRTAPAPRTVSALAPSYPSCA